MPDKATAKTTAVQRRPVFPFLSPPFLSPFFPATILIAREVARGPETMWIAAGEGARGGAGLG